MEILHVCPANCVTGGPEAIHEFVSELNKLDGINAKIWYWDISSMPPQPEEYKSYNCDYVTDLPDGFDGVLIVPEIWANRVMDFPQCKRAVYWLGIDAYARWNPEQGAFLRDKDIVHIAQSEYALDFLKKLGVRHVVKCTDMLNAEFYEAYTEEARNDVVLFNPAKATPFMNELMSQCDGIDFKPLQNMTRAEMIDTMRHSKLYVDFGEFPGRERIPREAALCGCCLITSKIGAADYFEDFSHNYKYDSKHSHIWAIVRKIRYVLENYDECRKDFDQFRQVLKADRDDLGIHCAEVVEALRYEI